MAKRTPEQWRALFAAQSASDLSQAQFCKQHKLCPKYFSLRRRQLTGSKEVPNAAPALIKVQPPTHPFTSGVSLHYQGIEIRFQQVDPFILARLLKQLA